MFTNKLTEERKHTNYASICIDIDTRYKYPNSVMVVVDRQKAYYKPIEYNCRP